MAEYRTVTVTATVSENIITATGEVSVPITIKDLPEYAGTYEVTPSQETQTLATAQMAMTENVVINPIPSNYGLITWNGSTLTVS